MNLALLMPVALAALAAMLLPLLIHLARRNEQRPTEFAALRWLRQKPKPRHRIRFDEWPLLLLRLLLLILLALWLAKPVLHGSSSDAPWIVVLPGVEINALRKEAADTGAELRWLAPGFPVIDDTAPPVGTQPVASLLRELDADISPAAKLRVVVPTQLEGADAQRPHLSRTVEWRVVNGEPPVNKEPATTQPPALTVRYAPDRQSMLRYLRAAATSWQPANTPEPDFTAALIEQPLPTNTQALIWLAPGKLPTPIKQWISDGGTALLDTQTQLEQMEPMTAYWSDDLGNALVEGHALGQGRILRFTRPLQPASMPQLLEPDFPQHLRRLFGAQPPAPSRVMATDYTPVPGAEAAVQAPRDLQPWLALLIALVLLVERWLATQRRRGEAP